MWQVVGNKLISSVDKQPPSNSLSLFKGCEQQFPADTHTGSIFLEYSVLVICAYISVIEAKKEKKRKKKNRKKENATLREVGKRVPTKSGKLQGARLRSTDRLIIPVSIYLRTWSLVSLFSASPFSPSTDLSEISSFPEFLDHWQRVSLLFFHFTSSFFSLFSRIGFARCFVEEGENSFFDEIHRSEIRKRVKIPWQRENFNDRTAWERLLIVSRVPVIRCNWFWSTILRWKTVSISFFNRESFWN